MIYILYIHLYATVDAYYAHLFYLFASGSVVMYDDVCRIVLSFHQLLDLRPSEIGSGTSFDTSRFSSSLLWFQVDTEKR